jgi:hypothetical protein
MYGAGDVRVQTIPEPTIINSTDATSPGRSAAELSSPA